MSILELSFSSGEDSLSVRRFSVQEAVSSLFTISVWARENLLFAVVCEDRASIAALSARFLSGARAENASAE